MNKGVKEHNSIGSFYLKYRDVILFNKNLIISGTCAFFTAALVTQLYLQFDKSNLSNSIIALATEYGVYIPIFAFLFYRDNKLKYIDPQTGKRDSKRVRGDIWKLFAAFSVSEIIYSLIKVYVHYQFLQLGAQPYQASMISSLVAWGIFLLSINVSIKAVRLFRR